MNETLIHISMFRSIRIAVREENRIIYYFMCQECDYTIIYILKTTSF